MSISSRSARSSRLACSEWYQNREPPSHQLEVATSAQCLMLPGSSLGMQLESTDALGLEAVIILSNALNSAEGYADAPCGLRRVPACSRAQESGAPGCFPCQPRGVHAS
ncbi:hypothetical protein N656DRAFT_773209 [Canariomyces notabilis]|uniref:Uncharacterized protein n=1 Tax=Canariomyces notabilis TaxID=2074819 RepID=A0AAN6YWZ3_9PEZI|nr:hypothetical protein N656DRAFT_773209 [Canariomyces arenarius]